MQELYELLENLLNTENKVKSLQNVLEMLSKTETVSEETPINSVISISIDSLECIKSNLHSSISELDLFLAENACNFRNKNS